MTDDFREELSRVKARESRYKKASEEKIANLKTELAEALAEMEKANLRAESLAAENADLLSNIVEQEETIAKLRKDIAISRQDTADSSAALDAMRKELDEARKMAKELDRANIEIAELKSLLKGTQTAILSFYQADLDKIKNFTREFIHAWAIYAILHDEIQQIQKITVYKKIFFTSKKLSNGHNVITELTVREKDLKLAKEYLVKSQKEVINISKSLSPYEQYFAIEELEIIKNIIQIIIMKTIEAYNANEELRRLFWQKEEFSYKKKVPHLLNIIASINAEVAQLGRELDAKQS